MKLRGGNKGHGSTIVGSSMHFSPITSAEFHEVINSHVSISSGLYSPPNSPQQTLPIPNKSRLGFVPLPFLASSMACRSIQAVVPSVSGLSSPSSSYCSVTVLPVHPAKFSGKNLKRIGVCRAMVQQAAAPGASATYAKEMERLSAKESLLLAFKDAGAFEALIAGRTTDMQKIDVNERIVGLERLNPTPRPTTSPFLEGRWNFEWTGYGSPGLLAARLISERFPATLANLSKMDVVIKDGYAKITANMKFLNAIESKFILTAKLTVEGPLRMKEEYTEGMLENPTIDEDTIPQQLKGLLGQAVNTVQQLPAPIRDAVVNGFKIPLGGAFQRLFMVSYLDEEILIIRDTAGVPEVLTRLDAAQSPLDSIEEYES